jgi:tRNA A-37 threonylcarbamoyl transferase component Bud32
MKRYNVKGFFYILKHLFRSSRAKKAWFASNSMQVRDISTPDPLLYFEERRFLFLFKSYFVTKAVPDARVLDEYVVSRFPGFSRLQKLSLIRTVARQLKKMHDRGICHGDLKAKNILIRNQNDDGQHTCSLVDFDAVKILDHVEIKERCRDLARLNCSFLNTSLVSRAHRLLFLKYYFGTGSRRELKKALRMVVMYTGMKLEKSGRAFEKIPISGQNSRT